MPSLQKKDLFEILQTTNTELSDYRFFVETGTWMGETILNFVNEFDKLYTIEVSERVYHEFNKKNYDRKKIQSLLGDSSIVIKEVLSVLNNKTIFFLDGHYSSGDTGKGVKDVPLVEELTLINEYFKHETIIIIDDLRLFGTKMTEDWSDITKEKLLPILSQRIIEVRELNDRLIIKLDKK